MKFVFGSILGTLLAVVTACTSTPPKSDCSALDWYEYGRRDGSNGEKVELFQTHTAQCEGNIEEKHTLQYLSGRNTGLTDYCTAESAWETGRSGRSYNHVCPINLEPEFTKFYELGLKMFELESRNAAISEEIDLISHRLRIEHLDLRQKFLLTAQLEQLKHDKESLSRKLDRIQNQVSLQ